MPVTCHDCDQISSKVNLITLKNNRKVACVLLGHKAFAGLIACPEIIDKFNPNVPAKHLRHSKPIASRMPSYFIYFNCFNRSMLHANSFAPSVDLFSYSSCLDKRLR